MLVTYVCRDCFVKIAWEQSRYSTLRPLLFASSILAVTFFRFCTNCAARGGLIFMSACVSDAISVRYNDASSDKRLRMMMP